MIAFRFFLSCFFVLTICFISFCQTDSVYISGKIDNQTCDSVYITNNIVERVLKLDSSGRFSGHVSLKPGYYYIHHGNPYAFAFIMGHDSLHITLNAKQFDKSTKYYGTHQEINRYLLDKYFYKSKFMHIISPMTVAMISEEKFLSVSDSLAQLQLDFLFSYDSLPTAFIELEKLTIWSERLYNISQFESYHRYFSSDKAFKVSSNYPKFRDSLQLDNESLSEIFQYNMYMNTVLLKQYFSQRDSLETLPFMVSFLTFVDSTIDNPVIRDQFLMSIYPILSMQSKSPHQMHAKLLTSLSNDEHKSIAEKWYVKENSLKYMDRSPDFGFRNLEGDTIHLSDFRGKYVYIDIWATWCQPCLKEIPYLNSLDSSFMDLDIAFISISKGDSFKDWEKFVRKKPTGGVQLYAGSEGCPFFTEFFVTGIPRSILINKTGKILDPHAKRPSNPELEAEILKLLRIE